MAGPVFQLLNISNADSFKGLQYIFHKESGLKIIVYPLHLYPHFEADDNELHFFGQLFQWWHVFETWDYRDHQDEMISAALTWYAELKMFPSMLPTLIDPRTARKKGVHVN